MSRAGARVPWVDVPGEVQRAVEDAVGSAVVTHDNLVGGFSPGPAGPARLTDGRSVFIKACGDELNPVTPWMHRREAHVLERLPSTVPAARLLASVDTGSWVVIVTELLPGRTPMVPLTRAAIDAVLELVVGLARAEDDAGFDWLDPVGHHELERSTRWAWRKIADEGLVDRLDGWARANLERLIDLEHDWVEAAHGTALLHRDLRTDNIVITPDGAVAVDWPTASRGAEWIDLVGLLPSLHLDGGPDPVEVFGAHPLGRNADADAVNSYLASLAGYFVRQSLLPPPPGIGGVRSFQGRQGEIACNWLQQRLT